MLRRLSVLLVMAAIAVAACVAPQDGADQATSDGPEALAMQRLHDPPLGLPPVPVPADNPPTPEKITLGRKLFFDPRLSFDGTIACATCHVPEQGFTQNETQTPTGASGKRLRRNAPTVLNSAYVERLFHDGRETSLETQVLGPLLSPDEMANPSAGWAVAKIASLDDYTARFEAAFGGGPTIDRIGQAIASWQRTLLAGNSPFDRWYYAGDEQALSDIEREGFGLFAGKAKCVSCHIVSEQHTLLADHSFHDLGVGYVDPAEARAPPDLGRFEITGDARDRRRFRTPSLRNVALTAPYMHDGSLLTLEEVVRFYQLGGVAHEGLDPLLHDLELSDDEVDALVAFLESLTSSDIDALIDDARRAAR